jgi:cbb3-type cytochrome oxidase subunit 3
MPGDFWGVVLILGPLVLLGVIIWAFLRNKAAGPRSVEQAEEGAVRLREQIERDPDPS